MHSPHWLLVGALAVSSLTCHRVQPLGTQPPALSVSAPLSTSATFFVSSSRGNDGNAGTGPDAPLATVEAGMARLHPGDSLLLQRGDAWTLSRAVRLGYNESGGTTPSRGITIAAFGSGATGAERPLLLGPPNATVGSELIHATDVQGLLVAGVAFGRVENALTLEYTRPGGTYANVSVVDCHFRDVAWANFTARAGPGLEGNITAIYGGGNAVRLVNAFREQCQPPSRPCAPPTLSDLALRHNIFERVDMAFTSRLARCGLPRGTRMGVSTVRARVEGNLFTACSFNAVMIDAATGFSLQHNVFLRNAPRILFGYGTTDVIVAYADETTVVARNDFVLRGEHAGDPDGCPIDLETDCHNLTLGPDNTMYRSVGASVNIFGHAFAGGPPETSKNLTIAGNVIVQNGCLQGHPPYHVGSSDVGAIAFDLPGGTGRVAENLIVRCADSSVPLWGGPPNYTAGFAFAGNEIIPADQEPTRVCALPRVAAAAAGARAAGAWPGLNVSCATAGATLRYTLDGSRPTEAAAEWPPPGDSPAAARSTAVLVRAFKDGLAPSATNGAVVVPPASTRSRQSKE